MTTPLEKPLGALERWVAAKDLNQIVAHSETLEDATEQLGLLIDSEAEVDRVRIRNLIDSLTALVEGSELDPESEDLMHIEMELANLEDLLNDGVPDVRDYEELLSLLEQKATKDSKALFAHGMEVQELSFQVEERAEAGTPLDNKRLATLVTRAQGLVGDPPSDVDEYDLGELKDALDRIQHALA